MAYTEKLQNFWSSDSKRLFVTTSPFGRQTYFYPQELGWFKTKYPYFVEREGFDSHFILVTVSGEGALEYEGKKYRLDASSVAWIDCFQRHRYYTPEGKAPWVFFWLHFTGLSVKGYYQQFRSGNGSPLLRVKNPLPFQNKIRDLITLEETASPKKEALSSMVIVELLTAILCLSFKAAATSNGIPRFLRETADEMDKRFTEYLSLTYFAEKHHVNASYLSREFRRHFGVTLKQYLTRKRISKAKEYLKYSDLTVSEIAERTGFENSSYFIRTFKKSEAVSPLAFRRSGQ